MGTRSENSVAVFNDVVGLHLSFILGTMVLFSTSDQYIKPDLPDADLYYFPHFLDDATANYYYENFLNNLNWQQHYIKIFGKTLPQPRLSALYAENTTSYTYSGLTLQPEKYTEELKDLQIKLLNLTQLNFTHCLANLYRSGNDSMGWHSDDERELGKDPVIASLSFGGKRNFQLKHKAKKDLKFQLEPGPGSLLIMAGKTQEFWKHQIPKTTKPVPPRINLTFRVLLS